MRIEIACTITKRVINHDGFICVIDIRKSKIDTPQTQSKTC